MITNAIVFSSVSYFIEDVKHVLNVIYSAFVMANNPNKPFPSMVTSNGWNLKEGLDEVNRNMDKSSDMNRQIAGFLTVKNCEIMNYKIIFPHMSVFL